MLLNLSVKTGRGNQTHYHKCYKPAATSPDNVENITPEKYTFRLKCVLKQNTVLYLTSWLKAAISGHFDQKN
jgi:hypothetical protein